MSSGCEAELLMLVAAQVRIPADDTTDAAEGHSNPSHVHILPDPINCEQWYCIHDHGASLLTTPWLQDLASLLLSCESRPVLSLWLTQLLSC